MACKVGITTDPKRRKKEWQQKYPSLHNWKTHGQFDTKTKAQQAENEFAQSHGCEAHPGGGGKERAKWHLYSFEL